MKGYLIDTDICVFFLKAKFGITEKIKEVGIENCFVSEITIAELIYGAVKSENFDKRIKDVEDVKSLFNVIKISESFEFFGREKVRLQKMGELIPDFDLLIGVSAVSNELTLVTNNVKHLERIEGVNIENWTKSESNKFVN